MAFTQLILEALINFVVVLINFVDHILRFIKAYKKFGLPLER